MSEWQIQGLKISRVEKYLDYFMANLHEFEEIANRWDLTSDNVRIEKEIDGFVFRLCLFRTSYISIEFQDDILPDTGLVRLVSYNIKSALIDFAKSLTELINIMRLDE